MLRFARKTIQIIRSAVALSLAIAASTNAQIPNGQPTVLMGTQDFLKAFYPELFGRKAIIRMSLVGGADRSWNILAKIDFDVMRFDPGSEVMLNPPYDARTGLRLSPPENTLLRGNILFDSNGWLHTFEAEGDVAHAKEYDGFVKLLDAHHEWSDDDAQQALKEAGAQFGPLEKSKLIKAIHLENFQHFMGRLEFKSAQSEPLPENHSEGNTALGSYEWVVTVDRILANGKRIPYNLRFEPFAGKLIGVKKKGEPIGVVQEDK